MALSKSKKFKFTAIMMWNCTGAKIIKINIYGVRLLGIQFTPKSTADVLKIDGKFSTSQQEHFNIKLVFNTYIFLPRFV